MAPAGAVQFSPKTPPINCAPSSRAKTRQGSPWSPPCEASGSPALVRSRTPNRQVSRRRMRLPAGGVNTQLPLRKKPAFVVLVLDDCTSSWVGHWSAMSYEAGSGGKYWPLVGFVKSPYWGCHARLMPPAPGAPQDTTSYLPADATGAPTAAVAST